MIVFKIYTVLFIFIMSSKVFAQNTVEETRPLDLIKESGFQEIIKNTGINPTQMEDLPSHSNLVYIDQIGSNNSIIVNTATETSRIDLIQKGNNNVARLRFSALSAVDTFRQQGDNHYLATFGKTPSLNLQRTVNQTGYGQNLTIHGSNSLSEKMQLRMKGSGSTIIIRNFN